MKKYVAISSDGTIDRITAKDREEAYFALDQMSLDGEDWVLLTQARAKKMAEELLEGGE